MFEKLLDNHGPKIGAALCALSAAVMMAIMIIGFVITLGNEVCK